MESISIEKSLLEQTGNLLEALLLTYFKNVNSSEAKTLESIICELSLPISKATLSRAIRKLEKQGFIAIEKDRFTNKTYFEYTLKSVESQANKPFLKSKVDKKDVEKDAETDVKKTEVTEIRSIVEKQLDYNVMEQRYGDKMNAVVEILTEVFSSNRKFLRVNSSNVHNEVVKSRLKQLNTYHIDMVMDKFRSQYKRIKNIKSYLLTMLFNVVIDEAFDYENLYNAEEYARYEKKRKERLELKQQEHEVLVGQMIIEGKTEDLERVWGLENLTRQKVYEVMKENHKLKKTLDAVQHNATKTLNVLKAD